MNDETEAGWLALGVVVLILGIAVELGGAFIFRSMDWVFAGLAVSITGGVLIVVAEIAWQKREWVLRAK